MKKLFTLLLLAVLVGAAAAAITAVASRKKFENMSDDEIREFLATKLEGKVSEEQVTSIQDSVIAGVRARQGGGDHYVEDVEVAVEELTHVSEDVDDEVVEVDEAVEVEVADDAVDEVSDKATEAGEKVEEIVAAVVEVTEVSEDDAD